MSTSPVYRSFIHELDRGAMLLPHPSDHHTAPKCGLSALPAILTTCRTRGLDLGPLAKHRLGSG